MKRSSHVTSVLVVFSPAAPACSRSSQRRAVPEHGDVVIDEHAHRLLRRPLRGRVSDPTQSWFPNR
jgi:hypothetical protein